MHLVNGRIIVYYSVKKSDVNHLVICGAYSTTDSPLGPYKNFPEPVLDIGSSTIDVNIIHEEGTDTNWLVWKKEGSITPFSINKLSEDGSKVLGDPIELMRNDLFWEGILVEGPWLHYRAPYYYIFYSGQAYDLPGYSIGIARSKKITGPYEKAAGPVFSQFAYKAKGHYFVAPGHNSVLTLPNSNVDIIVYHAWINGGIHKDPGRVTCIDKIYWTEDGWPIAGIAGTPSHQEMPDPLTKEFAEMKMDVRLPIGSLVSLASYQWDHKCWSSEDGTINGDCDDENNWFWVRKGMAGHPTITLESYKKPGFYWRHYNDYLVLNENDGSAIFKEDCSFLQVAGVYDQAYVTLRPINYPWDLMRHFNAKIRHDLFDESETCAQDGSWKVKFHDP